MSEAAGGERVYRCHLGHEIRTPAGATFSALRVDYGDRTKARNYDYCPHCFGLWAVRQFPLKLQDNPELTRD